MTSVGHSVIFRRLFSFPASSVEKYRPTISLIELSSVLFESRQMTVAMHYTFIPFGHLNTLVVIRETFLRHFRSPFHSIVESSSKVCTSIH